MRLPIALIVWIGAAVAAAALSSAVAHSVHNERAAASFDASAVRAADPQSLFRASNFERALGSARRHLGAGAKLDMLVVYPGYLSLTVVRAGSEADVYINAAGSYSLTNTGGNPGLSGLFSLARVTAGVPAALTRRIATSGHLPTSRLNYMIAEVDPADHRFRWLVYPLHGTGVEYFEASSATGRLFELRTNSATGLQPLHG